MIDFGEEFMYCRKDKGWLEHIDFAFLDLLCMQVSLAVAYFVRHRQIVHFYKDSVYQNVILLLILFEVVYLLLIDGYNNVLKRGYYIEFVSVAKEVCIMELLLTFYLFAVKSGDDFSRIVLFLFGIYQILLGYAVRILWKKHLIKKQSEEGKNALLLVTTQEYLEQAIDHIHDNNFMTYFIAGIVILGQELAEDERSYEDIILIPEKEMIEWTCRNWVDEALIVLPRENTFPKKYMEAFSEMGIVTHYSIMQDFAETDNRQIAEKICGYLVLTSGMQLVDNKQYLAKRIIDIVGGIIGTIATILLTIMLGPLIYIKSPGPIFFSQERVGKNGKMFRMYKFRTMYLDAEKQKKTLMEQNLVADGMMFKMEDDPRIIGSHYDEKGKYVPGIGNLIRKLSLDEFPQFVNVLLGDMSLVGTRPPTVDEYEKYKLHHKARLSAKPGITGLWQVSGRSEITDFEDVVKLDTEYINDWSIGKDLSILIKTVQVVLSGKGSM